MNEIPVARPKHSTPFLGDYPIMIVRIPDNYDHAISFCQVGSLLAGLTAVHTGKAWENDCL